MAIIVDRETKLVVQGLTGSEGRFHGVRNRDYGTQVVAGVTPGKGGQDVEGIPVFNTVAEAVAETGANTSMIFVPARFAADAIYEGVDAGIATVVCIAEGLPAHEMLRVYTYIRPKGITMIGPNCPGALSPGEGERRHHPRRDLPRGRGRARLPLGHADLPDRPRADPARARQLDDRRDRRRPGRRLVVHRRARALRGRSRDRARGDGRRDRRRRGGEGRALHPGADEEAGARLHRGLLSAAREDDGPRGRDHLRLVRDGAGQEGGARGVRGAGRDDADRGRADGGRPERERAVRPGSARCTSASSCS